ncbi:MAG TPA: hypothetical protein VG028_09355 [Terriglobia bacterium]|nr:hypothetical protein [Terriglobia bacterium]
MASAIDSLLSAVAAQLAEVRRRDRTDPSKTYSNQEAMAKLDSFCPSHGNSSSK